MAIKCQDNLILPILYLSFTINAKSMSRKTLNLYLPVVLFCCALIISSLFLFNKVETYSTTKDSPKQALHSSLLDYEKQIDSLIKLMTLAEKVKMIHASSSFTSGGVERLGIPEIYMSDGPHGVRKEHGRDWSPDNLDIDSATYLPTGITLASTWNPTLAYEYGKVLGQEAKFRGKDIILGPGINIMRSPLNGRNFEYFSEDPFLITQLSPPYIQGVQEQGVSACVKHFLANNQETDRGTINVLMSERSLREIYLPGFKAAINNGDVYSVMGAYNKYNGQHCTHNEYLVNNILKGELGFKGIMISDWAAVHNTMEAIKFGTDIEMGSELGPELSQVPKEHKYDKFLLGDTVVSMVKNGLVAESYIDDKVRRILRVIYQTKLGKAKPKGQYNTREHQQIALRVAEEGIVLLKNQSILPLDRTKTKSVAVIGANANRKNAGGGGSSQVTAKYELTPFEGLKQLAEPSTKIMFAEGYKVEKNGGIDNKLIEEAVAIAKKSEVAILVGGWIHGYSDGWNDNAFDAEAVDKPNMHLPFGQDELFNAVLKANHNTIIILIGGGAVDVTGWGEKAKAIIQAGYPGMEGGKALAKIIYGDVNPSGKLTFTFPKKLEDSPAHKLGEFPGNGTTVNYKEGIFVGYRYFDTYKVEPAFPFGHGLSYTTFSLRDLKITQQNETVVIHVKIKNTGKINGAEVVQVYVKDDEASVQRPEKELKGFQKVWLDAGEEKEIEFILDNEAFQFFDESKAKWVLEPGTFSILIGNSSQNIILKGQITL